MSDLYNKLTFVSLEQIQTPRSGKTIVNSYWVHDPGKGVAFFRSSPQCNTSECITKHLQEKLYPNLEVIFIPVAFLGYDWEN